MGRLIDEWREREKLPATKEQPKDHVPILAPYKKPTWWDKVKRWFK